MIRRALIFALITAAATPAAADERWYAYEAEGAAARHRTGDLTVQVSRGFFGGATPTQLFRRRGADLPLRRAGVFREEAVRALIGGDAPVYTVEGEAGRGFAQGACEATEAWIAVPTPERFRPLRLHVLGRDAAGGPRVCEVLEYRWRAEWDVPNRRRLPREDPRAERRAF